MKFTKAIAAALLVAATSTAFATGYATYEYSEEENRATSADNIANAVVVGMKTAEGWDYSLKSILVKLHWVQVQSVQVSKFVLENPWACSTWAEAWVNVSPAAHTSAPTLSTQVLSFHW